MSRVSINIFFILAVVTRFNFYLGKFEITKAACTLNLN